VMMSAYPCNALLGCRRLCPQTNTLSARGQDGAAGSSTYRSTAPGFPSGASIEQATRRWGGVADQETETCWESASRCNAFLPPGRASVLLQRNGKKLTEL
jgi:hypothetical protein